MHLLYLDDSGSVNNPNEEYVVLGGISLYETQGFYISSQLDSLAQKLDPVNYRNIEFHASEIFARRTYPWNKLSKDEARDVIKAVLKIVAHSSSTTYAFACAIHKKSFPTSHCLNLAFEDLCQRFDIYLSKINAEGDRQKGLLILDESSHETTLQGLAKNFREIGTQWGSIHHLADTPFFVDSKASRIIQVADHIAYAVFRQYNHGDASYFDIIAHKFFQNEGVVHRLTHKQKQNLQCMCQACLTRRLAG